ncbi:hypothetical protein [Acinetobacter pittii]|uniref:hypothetical protein n=1 Tax=Acinetobacter pittii TaxID=48296 RepID=UPI0013D0DFFE|nr:hypothetical protein [Acinetobacter pittii]QWZ61125.1 hypothetical protein I6L28_03825 [Acinetobacter pittii]
MKLIFLTLVVIFFSACSHAEEEKYTNSECVLNDKACLGSKDDEKYLLIRRKEYPSISYYNDIEIKELGEEEFQVINTYSDKSPIEIYSNFLLKDNLLILSSIKTISYPNIPPRGAKEECNIKVNKTFDKPLEYYVDNRIFDLNEQEKKKICKIRKNIK